MNNENKEFFTNDVETNISEEEIVLAPPTELFDEAKEIAQNTKSDEKFPLTLQYDANQKEFLLSILQTVGAIVENDDEEGHMLATMMNMTQLAFIKRLDCVERVRTNESMKPFRAEEIAKSLTIKDQQKIDSITDKQSDSIVAMELNSDTSTSTSIQNGVSNDGVSVASVTASARSSCSPCHTNGSMATAREISTESNISGNICCPGAEQWFKFTAPETATYTIYTESFLDTVGALYDCCGNLITSIDDYAPCGKIDFRIIYDLTAGNTYYVKVNLYGNDTGSYYLRVTKKTLVDYISVNPSAIVLECGKTYELPILPNTFTGVNGATPLSNLCATVYPTSADEKKVSWTDLGSGIFNMDGGWYNGQRYETITPIRTGSAKLYAYDWKENGMRGECTVNVDNMLIYRTRNRERLGFYDQSDNNDTNPITAEDLTYGSKSTQTMITNGTRIAMSDLSNYNSISQRVTIIKNFFNSQINYDETFMEILSEMVDHFVDGTGTDYSNEALTSAVQSHSRTTSYVNSVVTLVKNYISNNKTAVGNLAYDENLWIQPIKRASHPLVSAMNTAISNGAKELYLPAYPRKNGVPGLTLAIDGFYGNKIILKNFQSADSTYSGTLEFTFYDHFGLDTPDLTDEKFGNLTPGTLPGFKQWFILQHWSDLEGTIQPKPFVTNVSFSVPFSGTYE